MENKELKREDRGSGEKKGMENRVSKRIKRLLLAILLLFLIPSVIDFVSGFSSGLNEFKRGMKAGQSVFHAEREKHFFVKIEPVDADSAFRLFDNGTKFTPLNTTGELAVPRPEAGSGWVEASVMLLSLAVSVALIIFLVQLIRFAIVFPRRRIMARDNIDSLRLIAGSLGALGLAAYGVNVIQFFWLRGHVVLEGYSVRLDTPPSSLIVALILLAMTEILKLVGKLQNEQDLTI